MYKIPKQHYTVEFKQDAVRQVEVEGKSPAQVARDLGISAANLRRVCCIIPIAAVSTAVTITRRCWPNMA